MDSRLGAGELRQVGSYRLTSRLGQGGMGTVYLATDPRGRQVAVKLLRTDLMLDEHFRGRFRSEVNRARQVPPFCTAEVLDADPYHDPPYLVVEYIEGQNLFEVVRGRGPLSGATLHSVAVGIATALTAIHGAGVVHRDLKPGNVLFGLGGIKVIDFGIARALDPTSQHSRTSQTMGTLAYMAPERFDHEAASRSGVPADIFAWGAVVAYAGTGRTPFAADSGPATAMRILTQPPELFGLSGPLRSLVEQALAKDPRERPSSRELLDRLLAADQRDAVGQRDLPVPRELPGGRDVAELREPAGRREPAGARDPGGARDRTDAREGAGLGEAAGLRAGAGPGEGAGRRELRGFAGWRELAEQGDAGERRDPADLDNVAGPRDGAGRREIAGSRAGSGRGEIAGARAGSGWRELAAPSGVAERRDPAGPRPGSPAAKPRDTPFLREVVEAAGQQQPPPDREAPAPIPMTARRPAGGGRPRWPGALRHVQVAAAAAVVIVVAVAVALIALNAQGATSDQPGAAPPGVTRSGPAQPSPAQPGAGPPGSSPAQPSTGQSATAPGGGAPELPGGDRRIALRLSGTTREVGLAGDGRVTLAGTAEPAQFVLAPRGTAYLIRSAARPDRCVVVRAGANALALGSCGDPATCTFAVTPAGAGYVIASVRHGIVQYSYDRGALFLEPARDAAEPTTFTVVDRGPA